MDRVPIPKGRSEWTWQAAPDAATWPPSVPRSERAAHQTARSVPNGRPCRRGINGLLPGRNVCLRWIAGEGSDLVIRVRIFEQIGLDFSGITDRVQESAARARREEQGVQI